MPTHVAGVSEQQDAEMCEPADAQPDIYSRGWTPLKVEEVEKTDIEHLAAAPKQRKRPRFSPDSP